MDASTLNTLPKDVSEALLLQAWQQLDQRHRFGIIPLVCKYWYHLSLPSLNSLELGFSNRNPNAMQQLGVWLQRHGTNLRQLSLEHNSPLDWDVELPLMSMYRLPHASFARALETCTSLVSLRLRHWEGYELPELQPFTQLTSLGLHHTCSSYIRRAQPIIKMLLNLPQQLRSLDLSDTKLMQAGLGEQQLQQLVSRLPNLTSLDLRRTYRYPHGNMAVQYLASCQSLPPLQELKLSLNCPSPADSILSMCSLEDLEALAKVSLYLPGPPGL